MHAGPACHDPIAARGQFARRLLPTCHSLLVSRCGKPHQDLDRFGLRPET